MYKGSYKRFSDSKSLQRKKKKKDTISYGKTIKEFAWESRKGTRNTVNAQVKNENTKIDCWSLWRIGGLLIPPYYAKKHTISVLRMRDLFLDIIGGN